VYFGDQKDQWHDFVGAMFSRLDANGDQKLNRTEFESALKPSSVKLADDAQWDFDFSDFDGNGAFHRSSD
jgi:Ca2+-binding EF-hand superfamily protein